MIAAEQKTVWISPPSAYTTETDVNDPSAAPPANHPVLLPLPPEGWAGLTLVISMVALRTRERARYR